MMTFEEGRLTGFGIPDVEIQHYIEMGVPFMTSGCPGVTMENACNRPFANETPSQAEQGLMRNFPFRPNTMDVEKIKSQF
jgi:biotin synthase